MNPPASSASFLQEQELHGVQQLFPASESHGNGGSPSPRNKQKIAETVLDNKENFPHLAGLLRSKTIPETYKDILKEGLCLLGPGKMKRVNNYLKRSQEEATKLSLKKNQFILDQKQAAVTAKYSGRIRKNGDLTKYPYLEGFLEDMEHEETSSSSRTVIYDHLCWEGIWKMQELNRKWKDLLMEEVNHDMKERGYVLDQITCSLEAIESNWEHESEKEQDWSKNIFLEIFFRRFNSWTTIKNSLHLMKVSDMKKLVHDCIELLKEETQNYIHRGKSILYQAGDALLLIRIKHSEEEAGQKKWDEEDFTQYPSLTEMLKEAPKAYRLIIKEGIGRIGKDKMKIVDEEWKKWLAVKNEVKAKIDQLHKYQRKAAEVSSKLLTPLISSTKKSPE